MKYLIILVLLLLTACTTECPTINCKPCDKGKSIIEEETPNLIRIDAGTEVILVIEGNEFNIVNCGKIAYAPFVIEEIKERNLIVRNLIINNTDRDYIGGCKDILIEIPEIERVYIYGKAQDTQEYNDLISWTPSNKLIVLEDKVYDIPG